MSPNAAIFTFRWTGIVFIHARYAFVAWNWSFFFGVWAKITSRLVCGFSSAIMTLITFTHFTVPKVWSRRDCIACCRTFSIVAKSTRTFQARGVAGQVLVQPNDAILARSTAVGTNVWVLFPGRAFVAFVWTCQTGGRGIRALWASHAKTAGDGANFSWIQSCWALCCVFWTTRIQVLFKTMQRRGKA